MNKRKALALGIPSGLVILGGVLLSVLFYLLTKNIIEGINEVPNNDKTEIVGLPKGTKKTDWGIDLFGQDKTAQLQGSQHSAHHRSERSSGNQSSLSSAAGWPMWLIGIVYIIPGLFGFLSALIQKKGLYIASIVFSIFSLLIMAAITIVMVLVIVLSAVLFTAITDNCYDDNGVCKCRDTHQEFTLFKSCSYFKTFFSLSMALSFFLVFTWVALMVMFVLCCYYTCCAKDQGSQGIVLVPAQQPMIAPNQDDPAYPQQTYQYPPPQQYFDQTAPSKV